MSEPALSHRMTRIEFLAWEQEQDQKHEFYRGEAFAMGGARQAHVTTAGNCFALLKAHLRGRPCRAFIADMALEVDAVDALFYPDVFVSCHPEDLAAERRLHHPTAIIEVLSDSTAAFDRGLKFAAYRRLASLREYVLIDPEQRSIEIFRRTETDDWLLDVHASERGLVLASLDFEAPTESVFEDIPSA